MECPNDHVDVSVDKVRLLIQDVNAKVLLEARLKNLVYMVRTPRRTGSRMLLQKQGLTVLDCSRSMIRSTAST